MDQDPRYLWRSFIRRVGVMLALAGGIVFAYNFATDYSQIQETALRRGRAHFRDILLTWHWNSHYGGVYVEKKPGVESNTFLQIPDVVSREGTVYTLRDPDTMSREIADLARQKGDHQFHITSLRLKNPDNSPDDWERAALRSFETGGTEAFETTREGDTFLFRYMAPMKTEEACLACHSRKAYQVGGVHGGISVSFDISDSVQAWRRHQGLMGVMTLLSLGGVFLAIRLFTRRLGMHLGEISRRYEDLLHSSESIVWEADAASLQFTFIGDQVQRILGYRPEDWLEKDFWLQHIHPEDRVTVREALAAYRGTDGPLRLDYRLFDNQGKVVWIQDVISTTETDDCRRVLHGVMLDITERKNAEKRTQQLLAEQNAILQNVVVGIAFIRDRRIVSCNRRFEEIFGYGPGDLTGSSTLRLYGSEDIYEDVGKRAYEALANGSKFSEEVILHHRQGHNFWGAMTGQALNSADPHRGTIWIYADISQRRSAMEEANKLRRAVEQSPVSIVITDRNGAIEYVNPRFTTVTGYSRAEVIGRNPRILNSGRTPRELFEGMWSTLLSGREWRGQLWNRRKNGELFWEDASISPILTETGEISHFIAVKEDITQRKLTEDALRISEDRLKMAMEVSNDGIWDWHIGTGQIYFSTRWQRMLGYNPGELEPTIEALEEHIHPEDRQDFHRTLEEHLAGRTESYEAEYRTVTKAGDELWILGRGKVVERDADGNPLRLVGTHTDITERKQAQMALEQNQTQLEDLVRRRTSDLSRALEAAHAADRAKDEFLANMSHEIRTPLNAVIGLSGLALRGVAEPRQRDYLEKISGAGQTLLAIINDLLDLSKIAAGRLELENITFSLGQTMEKVGTLVAQSLADKGLSLDVRMDGDIPGHLTGDPLRIQQILLNLVSNAVKFTPRGGITVCFWLLSRTGDTVELGIEVEDTGIGLSAAEMERLFQPFAQADSSITRTHGGTGLGLTICRRLAEMMGGSITVTSRPGAGSTFRVLVRLGVAAIPVAQPEETLVDEDAWDIRYRNALVLVVDDQPINREIVVELLQDVGIECSEAGNGREAVELISGHPPRHFDLVFMDIQMPEMDGHSATRAIRQLPGQGGMPIIAMTAHAMEHEKLASLAAGLDDHLGKPFNPETFYRILARWMPAHRKCTAAPAPSSKPAQTEMPTIDGIDIPAGLHRFAGNRTAYLGWLEKFRDEGGAPLAAIVQDLEAGRREEALKALHALKGRVGMLAMTDLWQAVVALEAALKENRDFETLLAETRRQLERVQAGIDLARAPL